MGVEVTIGGWATTFLLAERGGDENSGYVTSGCKSLVLWSFVRLRLMLQILVV